MKPRELLGKATVPGGEELSLFRRGDDFMIVLGRNELMNSRMSGSEEALAALPADGRVTVAEIVPEIIGWARGPMAGLTGACLDDRRVALVEKDVATLIGGASGSFDAILLDVDNGPDGLSRPGNDRLYSDRGLALAKNALRPGGVLAIWSAAPDDRFTRRLAGAGFAVEQAAVRARSNGKGPRHVIWFARAPV
jgi:spermidine synthase